MKFVVFVAPTADKNECHGCGWWLEDMYEHDCFRFLGGILST